MEAPLSSLESQQQQQQHPAKLSLDNKPVGRFFLRSNSEDVSDSNSPPPTPTAQITSFFNSAVNSAAQALRKQPSKANSLGFSSTPSPSASGLTTPMTLTPTKHPTHQHQQHHYPPHQHLQQQHHQQFLQHAAADGSGSDFGVSPPDLFPLRPLSGVTSPPIGDAEELESGFAKPQLLTSPSASYSHRDRSTGDSIDPSAATVGSPFFPHDSSRFLPNNAPIYG